jgi:hypothetical protein
MKMQEMGIGGKKFNAIGNANHDRPERLWSGGSVLPTSPKQQAEKTAQDQEYVRLMEERYGIREEGVF